jgi:hypothetical protein
MALPPVLIGGIAKVCKQAIQLLVGLPSSPCIQPDGGNEEGFITYSTHGLGYNDRFILCSVTKEY